MDAPPTMPPTTPPTTPPPRAPRTVAAPVAVIALVVALLSLGLAAFAVFLELSRDLSALPPAGSSPDGSIDTSLDGRAATVVGTLPQFGPGIAYDGRRFTDEVRRALAAAGADPGTIACDSPGRLTVGSRIACTDTSAGVTDRIFVRVTDTLGHFVVTWDSGLDGAAESGTARSSA